jgi:hypothetical protein
MFQPERIARPLIRHAYMNIVAASHCESARGINDQAGKL